jgi:hypothetical protein
VASNQERLAVCEAVICILASGRVPDRSLTSRHVAVMREIRDIYASIVAKHNAKNAGPVKRKIDPRDLAEAMWEDIRR